MASYLNYSDRHYEQTSLGSEGYINFYQSHKKICPLQASPYIDCMTYYTSTQGTLWYLQPFRHNAGTW